MRTPEKAARVAVFFTGFLAWVALTGVAIAGVRLLGIASPRLASRAMRRMAVTWNRFVTAWACATLRVRVEVEGTVPPGRGWIVASNHQSILDIAVLSARLGSLNILFVGKEQMRRGIPNVSPCARYAGYAFVSRKRGDVAQIAELERLGAKLGPQRASAAIFPEGTRSRDGALGRFKAGGLRALLRTAPGARILPVTIDGTWRAATFASLFRDFPGMTIRLRVGAPIEVPPAARADRAAAEAFAERVREDCARALAEWRGVPVAAILKVSEPAESPLAVEAAPGR